LKLNLKFHIYLDTQTCNWFTADSRTKAPPEASSLPSQTFCQSSLVTSPLIIQTGQMCKWEKPEFTRYKLGHRSGWPYPTLKTFSLRHPLTVRC